MALDLFKDLAFFMSFLLGNIFKYTILYNVVYKKNLL